MSRTVSWIFMFFHSLEENWCLENDWRVSVARNYNFDKGSGGEQVWKGGVDGTPDETMSWRDLDSGDGPEGWSNRTVCWPTEWPHKGEGAIQAEFCFLFGRVPGREVCCCCCCCCICFQWWWTSTMLAEPEQEGQETVPVVQVQRTADLREDRRPSRTRQEHVCDCIKVVWLLTLWFLLEVSVYGMDNELI